MNEPIRQHWVPKVYLRHFATSDTAGNVDPQINVYDTHTNRKFLTSVNNIAVKRHLYTIGVNEPKKLYAVENMLSLIETKVKPYLEELANGNNVQKINKAKKILAFFLATLVTRNPRMLNLLHKSRDDDNVINKLPNQERNWFYDLNDEGMNIFFSRSILWSANPLANDLVKMKWCLIGASTGGFITTDNPLSVYHPSIKPYGILTPGAHIHFVVSPKYMLLIGNDLPVEENKTYFMPAEVINGFNSVLIWQAERYLVSSDNFDKIEWLIYESRKEI